MCGIAGILSPEISRPIDRMMDALHHRGPDGHGVYHDEFMSLGHRRLSIIDLDGGQQPISNETGRLQLVCNGEIYNSPQLRTELESSGHTFSTRTDVEVILHLYEEHGKDCVKFLRGMFAFGIWDSERRTLFLARDHLGQKPLFFTQTHQVFAFASEVKGLLATDSLKPELDLEALWHYLSLRFIPDQYSLFKGIRKLPAGTWLFLENGASTIERYWSVNFKDKLPEQEEEIVNGLESLLLETVQMHLLSDVRVGAFLSGGIDSSTISAMMATMTDQPVPTFSIGVKEQGFNELPYARQVVDRYQLESHEKVVQADIIHLIPWMIRHMDEPSDPFGVGVYLVSQLASEVVKVVLGGDGGDENFAGYDRFSGNRLVDYYCTLPMWFRKTVMKKLISQIPESFSYKSLAQKAAWVNDMSMFPHGTRYAQSMGFLRFRMEEKQDLFTESAKAQIKDVDSIEKILVHFQSDSADHLVDRMLHTDLMTRMPDHLLVVVDRMTMAHSLESRSPFLDYKVVEYAASIPAGLKLQGKNLKYILKKLASRYLPKDLIYRKKSDLDFLWESGCDRNSKAFSSTYFVNLGSWNSGFFSGPISIVFFRNICPERLTTTFGYGSS